MQSKLTKSILFGVSIIATLLLVYFFVLTPAKDFGAVTLGAGNWRVATTGVDQVISYGPAKLEKIVFGTANDAVQIGDVRYNPSPITTSSAGSNSVFKIISTVPQSFIVDTVFTQGIIANVTSTSGVVFILSPQ